MFFLAEVLTFGSRRERKTVGFSMNRDVTLKCWSAGRVREGTRTVGSQDSLVLLEYYYNYTVA